MPVTKLKLLLEGEGVKFITLTHSPAFTAQEIAAAAHIPGKEMAKTVMVKLDGKMAMAVVPAPAMVDLERLKEIAGADRIELATEVEFKSLFPECEAGAMPPFGHLYGMELFVDAALAEDEEILFNAGSHTELMKLSYADYERLAMPRVASFSSAVAAAV